MTGSWNSSAQATLRQDGCTAGPRQRYLISWENIGEKIGRIGHWEFEDYQP